MNSQSLLPSPSLRPLTALLPTTRATFQEIARRVKKIEQSCGANAARAVRCGDIPNLHVPPRLLSPAPSVASPSLPRLDGCTAVVTLPLRRTRG